MNWGFSSTGCIFNTSHSDLLKAIADIADCVAMHVEFHANFGITQTVSCKQQGPASSCYTEFKGAATQQRFKMTNLIWFQQERLSDPSHD